MAGCDYGKDIECPYWTCKKVLEMKQVVEHLQDVHSSTLEAANASGKLPIDICRHRYPTETSQVEYGIFPAPPRIIKYDSRIFIDNFIVRDDSWIMWVSILGSENDAKKYEVKMTASPEEDTPGQVSIRSKVYSTDVRKDDVLKDEEGGLELSKRLVKQLAAVEDGNKYKIEIDCQIMKK